jgi:hypothetical protein
MRRLLPGLFCLGALLGITACGSTARVSQDNSSQQQVTVLTPAGQMSTMRCDGKGPKDTWLFPSLADVPFPALVEGITHTTSAQGNASVEQWDACTAALSPTGVRAYYTTGMTANTWQTSAAFPDKNDTSTPCATDTACWKRVNGTATVYIALENVSAKNGATYFTVRQVTLKQA